MGRAVIEGVVNDQCEQRNCVIPIINLALLSNVKLDCV